MRAWSCVCCLHLVCDQQQTSTSWRQEKASPSQKLSAKAATLRWRSMLPAGSASACKHAAVKRLPHQHSGSALPSSPR